MEGPPDRLSLPLILVRGSGDVGSAVALRLFRAGHPVVIHDAPAPAGPRRGMAFTDAIFEGSATLAGVAARRSDAAGARERALRGDDIPVVTAEFDHTLGAVQPGVLVDARMRKRATPERQRGLAGLTIGLGPNFVAGDTVDLVVETSWGERLGVVLTEGTPAPLAGEPRTYGGHARERFIYAPAAGLFRTTARIAQDVQAGEVVATLDGEELRAPLDGILRGLTHDGVRIEAGTKCVEVDPRGDPSKVTGIGERPAAIAEGVLRAIAARRQRPG